MSHPPELTALAEVPQDARKYFLAYQRAWILDPARLRICEKGRQIGMSYADAYDSLRKAACQGGKDVWVMSRDEVQAKQYIRYCQTWARLLRYPLSDLGEQLLPCRSHQAVQAQVLKLASGACIYALSSNPDAIVGKTGHVKLDEFALHKDQRTLYAVAKPVTQWGGTLSVLSTHRGLNTVFNQILTDIKEGGNRMGWSHHAIPIQRAVQEGLVESIDRATPPSATNPLASGKPLARRHAWLEQQRRECLDEEQWLQEYCCVPADENTAFISYDMLHHCQEPECLQDFDYLTRTSNPLYLGVDIARKTDLCVLDVGEKIGDVVWDRMRVELRNRTFAEIRFELFRLLRLPRLERCAIDATGLGMQLAEESAQEFGWRVEPLHFSAPIKEDLAFGLRADFEQRNLRLARDDKLWADLRAIKKQVAPSGHLRFAGQTEDSHCDRFWALALRQHAARYQSPVWAAVG